MVNLIFDSQYMPFFVVTKFSMKTFKMFSISDLGKKTIFA